MEGKLYLVNFTTIHKETLRIESTHVYLFDDFDCARAWVKFFDDRATRNMAVVHSGRYVTEEEVSLIKTIRRTGIPAEF